jgi:hypothetical protein
MSGPTTKPSPVTPLIPVGEHYLTFVGVEVKEVENLRAQKDPTQPKLVNKWLWRFLSDDIDPESDPPQQYEYAHWTFENYGHARANLTKLLDQIIPKATPEQKSNLDTDLLKGRRFKAQIVHEKTDKGNIVAKAAFFVPTTEPPQNRPMPRFDPDTVEPTPEIPN